ncbi:type I DNA topoisomerase [Zavarzinia compransoris]|uniref:type I DNA topoisomerase n=1 Tax=Zavarzinia marina TaxID=2911065 RepID=UPI001EED9210|nr:type I DNA topoisomerase [Zavarzinia marina]MCF4166210.1 type I DNA topoisomerase [Zavarzinia marina]
MNVVIVESPAKAKTINKYLGSDYTVLASFGHVRDLPPKDGSVRPDEDFAMDWEVDADAKKRIADIAKALKGAHRLYLATDPDREGEAISWHVLQILNDRKALKGVEVGRITFNEITKSAVTGAIKAPRMLDQELIDAYLARRALDYLVGFTLSPVLWRKLPGARSAGRVQSVALRLICERELEIERFKSQEYWSVLGHFIAGDGMGFDARLTHLDGRKLDKFDINSAEKAEAAKAAIERREFHVDSVESKPGTRNPAPPFTTSTLQQEAARKLGFSAQRTMQLAQRLYEGIDVDGETVGLITYMRTDGVSMASEAIQGARNLIGNQFGGAYLPDSPRIYKTKAKNAQEAHEAIRPTDFARTPERLHRLDPDQRRLYDLIWKRALASQMNPARLERTTVDVAAKDRQVILRATGSVVLFDGFLALYQEGVDDRSKDDEDGGRLPRMMKDEGLRRGPVTIAQHFTEPPPRYSEASLVKKLEELGIGRPSTYASILSTLRDRAYVTMDRNRFLPEDKGRLVTAFLESFFARYVEYGFTAGLEELLDDVSAGKIGWKEVLRDFWRDFAAAIEGTKDLKISDVIEQLDQLLGPHLFPEGEPDENGERKDPRVCPSCGNGRLSLKLGKFGAFIGCSNYPECRFTRQFGVANDNGQGTAIGEDGIKILGEDPESGEKVSLRSGRFGPYVQLGEAEKPKRASLPKDMPPDTIDLEKALALLSLPREVGLHPETSTPIQAGIGRYGPYIVHDKRYVNLPTSDEVFTIGLNRAVALLAEPPKRGRRAAQEPLKAFGEHPEDGKPVNVMNGRFGPYVSWNGVFATIPKGTDPQSLTQDEALALLAAKVAKGGGPKKKAPRKTAKAAEAETAEKKKAAPKKKAPAKKPAAKKTAAKKTAAKSAGASD